LLQRIGEAGVNELIAALEGLGAGGEVLLKDISQKSSQRSPQIVAAAEGARIADQELPAIHRNEMYI
jgi:hypothetical protein